MEHGFFPSSSSGRGGVESFPGADSRKRPYPNPPQRREGKSARGALLPPPARGREQKALAGEAREPYEVSRRRNHQHLKGGRNASLHSYRRQYRARRFA